VARLAEIFLEQAAQGAHNINLVTPTHYAPLIAAAIRLARAKGLAIPVVYNTGGYDSLETIDLLAGAVDVYLPDLKYWDDRYAIRYSQAPGYFAHASRAIEAMVKQVGRPVFAADGTLARGVMVRHLLLPGLLADACRIVEYLASTFGDAIMVSLMNQYTPPPGLALPEELRRPVESDDYERLLDYAAAAGIEAGYFQESGTASPAYVPDFDCRGV